MSKGVLVLVADKTELSSTVLGMLHSNGIDVFEVGIGRESVERLCFNEVFVDMVKGYDEFWNIGSVGSVLPLYTVFEVSQSSHWELGSVKLSGELYDVVTVDSFNDFDYEARVVSPLSIDMELFHLYRLLELFGKRIRSFKYVSDNFDFVSPEEWYLSIGETARIVTEPLLALLRKIL